jgi:hypothetical protein
METDGEELSKLRAENSSSKQLLGSNDVQLPACKDELLASRAVESHSCGRLLQCNAVLTEPDVAAADSSKRQLLHNSSALPLDRDELLVEVFSFRAVVITCMLVV